MQKRKWAEEAIAVLKTGRIAVVEPKGHSMIGKINDGDTVILEPTICHSLSVNDVVLARITGRRYSHFVLHLILECDEDKYLIGSNNGRIDGWITSENIFGRVIKVCPPRRFRSENF